MDAVGFSESAPPLYYALAWFWTQVTGTGEFGLRSLSALAGVATVPVAYLIGIELRGRRAGLMAAALVAVNPMLLWYSQEARAYALLVLLCAVSLLYCVRALRSGTRRDFVLWGLASGLALATHYFAVFVVAAEAVWLLRRRGSRERAGARHRRPLRPRAGAAGDPPDVLSATPNGSATSRSGTGSGKPRRPSSPARPPTSSPARSARPSRCCRWPSAWPRWSWSRCAGDREERRAAAIPLSLAAAAIGIPLAAGAALSRQGLRPRPQRAAGAGAAAGRGRDRADAAARRAGSAPRSAPRCSPTRSASASGPASLPTCSAPTGTTVAAEIGEPEAPRATVTWVLGEASLRYYLSTGAIQVSRRRRLRLAGPRNRLRLRRQGAAAAGAPARPRLPRNLARRRRPPLHPPLRAAGAGPGAAAPARAAPGRSQLPQYRRPPRRHRPG